MTKLLLLSPLLVCLCNYGAYALNYPGPRVYVVTPSSRQLQIDEGKSAPFYYHKWMRRMDSPANVTTTSTTAAPRVKTPDLIFAEFESDRMKNIRKLLERERIEPEKPTTSRPIYVPDEEETQSINFGLPSSTTEKQEKMKDMTDYFALYNNMHGGGGNLPAPVFSISTPPSTSTTFTTASTINNAENVWHIIDSEKQNQYSDQWDEVPVYAQSDQDAGNVKPSGDASKSEDEGVRIDDDFAIPGFGTNPGNGAENESRAIRTEPNNVRFPYVNLKPFLIKNTKKPLLNAYSKKGNNMYTSLDNFFDIKNPVRGEAQEVVPQREPIDRYNSAQPYFPKYGGKSKQSSPISPPMKAVANLVPPPPPVPKLTANDFPSPVSYDSFPPYAPSGSDFVPPPPPLSTADSMPPSFQPPADSGDDSDSPGSDDSDDSPEVSYRYKPPPPSTQQFAPTLPPLKQAYGGYSYEKPTMMTPDSSPTMDMDDNNGYSYEKPTPAKPAKPDYGYHYSNPESSPPSDDDHPPKEYHGYHYSKPEPLDHATLDYPPVEHPPFSYGHHGPYSDDSEYPELIYNKPHEDVKGGDDMKGGGGMKGGGDMKGGGMKDSDDDMGMVPPPAPDMDTPTDDSGFPQDFPGDFHDFYHHHHHHPTTTTTTTTEMPRVNRYSYYYLGKKLYYLPLYFSVYFIIYVGALIIKAVLRHKIVYPNSWRPNDQTASFLSKRSVDSWDLSKETLHEMTGKVTRAIATAAEKYMNSKEIKI